VGDEAGRNPPIAALVLLLGQVGCLTFSIIIVSLVVGLWLDGRYDTRPLFALALVLLSAPISLYIMYRIVLGRMARLQSGDGTSTPDRLRQDQEAESGRDP
jgi:hypothetical protein